jgi:hypothetical protein
MGQETLFPVVVARSARRPDDLVQLPASALGALIAPHLTGWRAHGAWRPDSACVAATLADAAPRTWEDACAAVVFSYARGCGKQATRWGVKSPYLQLYAAEALKALPSAQLVVLVRDGRDVVASLREFPRAPREADAAARWWAASIRAGRAAARREPSRVREVRYERLVADPELVLRDLCGFLDLEWDKAMLSVASRTEGARDVPDIVRHPLHDQAPTTCRVGRWRNSTSRFDRWVVEATAGRELSLLGYDDFGPLTSSLLCRTVSSLSVNVAWRPTWPLRWAANRFADRLPSMFRRGSPPTPR